MSRKGFISSDRRRFGIAIALLFISCLFVAPALLMGQHAAARERATAPLLTATPTPTNTLCDYAWRVVPTTDLSTEDNFLAAVGAVATNDVWVVGWYRSGGRDLSVIKRWNGTQWNVVPSPNPGTGNHHLIDVDVVSANDIWAVGSYEPSTTEGERPFTLHWNGTAWSQVSNPTQSGVLYGVAAISANDVWAVGLYYPFPGSPGSKDSPTGIYSTLTMHWNGTAWTQVSTPSPSSADQLTAVAGSASNDVWAVGASLGGGPTRPLVLHWDGVMWQVVSTPSLSGNYALQDVVAFAPNNAWAVGYNELTEHWDGTQWTIVRNPPGSVTFLGGLAAISPTDMWAVGDNYSPVQFTTAAEHWNGSTWTVANTPNVGSGGNFLYDADAVSSTDVWAAGAYTTTSGYHNLVMRYSYACTVGTPVPTYTPTRTPTPTVTPCENAWHIVPNADVGTEDNILESIDTASSNDVWAVGWYTSGGRDLTLIKRWNGTAWNVVSSPNAGTSDNHLFEVKVISPNDVWAVGGYKPAQNQGQRPLTLHWNGTAWSVVGNPAVVGVVYGLTAISANDVWAVGSDSPILARFEETATGAYAAITLHWNGVSWSMITTPSPSGADQLSAVSGTSSGDVWAVGASLGGGGFVRPFIIHWDGSQWQTVGNPTLTGNYALEDVVAFAPNNVWAVGYSELTEHWDGIQWNIVWIQSGVPTFLAAITASSPTDKWAVGDNYSPSRFTTATRHWTGSVWSIVPSPNTGSGNNFLYDVDAFSSTDVWATGVYTDVAGFHGLIMRYNYGCGTGTPTPPITPSPLPPTSTPFSTSTPTLTPLVTFTPTQVVTPTMTETPCPMSFSDVHSGDYFYYPVLYLACHNVMSGYSDGTFRPYANTTRGQLTKIIVLAEGWKIDTSGGPHFSDVPSSDPFYDWVETAYHHNIISGYSDGTFRQYNDVTRSQLCKIVVLAEGWPIDTYGGPHFSDVPATYYGFEYIETAYHHGIITGYADGTFRPGNNATRGQISKIVYLAIMGQ